LVAAFLAPLVGRAADRHGVRPIGLLCLCILGIIYGLLAAMRGPIAIYYSLASAAVIFGLGTTGVVFMRAVSTHFTRSLGLALAVSRSGVAISAALLPVLIYHSIKSFGWRGGYALLAVVTLVVGLPACVMWISDDRSLPSKPQIRLAWRALLFNRKIVTLCLAVALTIGPVVGILSQLQPLLMGKSIAGGTAAVLGSILAVSVLVGTLLTGWLVDRIWAPLIGCVFLCASGVGCLLLLPQTLSVARATCAVALVGITQGAELDLAGYLIARYFGVADYAAIFGLTIFAIGLASAGSQMAFAFLFDRTGGYNVPLELSVMAFMIASVTFLALGRYPQR
jgi:MFS family permease